jgi:NhaP-type Na+/H+ or K+/H+ antiporter
LRYAVLSLTVIRMLLVFLCLIGTRTSTGDKLFIGWFGPRGLVRIVFVVLVLDEKLPGNDTITLTAAGPPASIQKVLACQPRSIRREVG